MILNIEQAKHNVKRYRSITIEEINRYIVALSINLDNFTDRLKLLDALTGLCYNTSCRMCKAVNDTCTACVWDLYVSDKSSPRCVNDNYLNIDAANTPEEIVLGYRERADILETLIAKAEESNERENIITTIT